MSALPNNASHIVKHTPGPWRVGPVDDTMVTDANGNEVAAIDGDYNDPDTGPLMEANARLIAAAPDLLAALKFYAGDNCDEGHRARAALSRATEGQ